MTQTLDGIFRHADSLARLHDHAMQLARLQRTLAPLLGAGPSAQVTVAQWEDGVLTLHAASNAVAARLRQSLPSLRQGLANQGWLAHDIQVKVRPRPAPPPAPAVPQRSLSRDTVDRLAGLAASLPDDSPMRDALRSLLANARRDG